MEKSFHLSLEMVRLSIYLELVERRLSHEYDITVNITLNICAS